MECFEPDEFWLLAENLHIEDFFFRRDWYSTTSRAGEAGRSSIPDREGESGRTGRLEQAPETGVAEQGGNFDISAPAAGTLGAADGITESSRGATPEGAWD